MLLSRMLCYTLIKTKVGLGATTQGSAGYAHGPRAAHGRHSAPHARRVSRARPAVHKRGRVLRRSGRHERAPLRYRPLRLARGGAAATKPVGVRQGAWPSRKGGAGRQ